MSTPTVLKKGNHYWAGSISGPSYQVIRWDSQERLAFASTTSVGTEQAADRIDLAIKRRKDAGYAPIDIPIPDWVRDEARTGEHAAYCVTAERPVTQSAIEESADDVQEILDAAGKAVPIRLVRYGRGLVRFVDSDEVDEVSIGYVPQPVWDGQEPAQQQAILRNGVGVNGYLNPQGRGEFFIKHGGRWIEFAVRLFLTRLATRSNVDIQEGNKLANSFDAGGFNIQGAIGAEWVPTYTAELEPLLAERYWLTGQSKLDAVLASGASGMFSW